MMEEREEGVKRN